MKMSITLPEMDDVKLKELCIAVRKVSKAKVYRQRNSVIVECDDNIIVCQKVIAISDTFWGGEDSVEEKGPV